MPTAQPTQTAMDPCGFMFQLPRLGLADRAGEWVTVRGASGAKDECAALLAGWQTTHDAPLRATETEFGTVKAQVEGAVWSVPIVHAQRQAAKTELFTIKLKRQPASAVSEDVERTRLPSDIDAIVLIKATLKLEAVSLPVSPTRKASKGFSVQVTGSASGSSCSLDVLNLYRTCLDPTAAQSKPDEPPVDRAAATEWKAQKQKRLDAALDMWLSNANYCLNLGWMQGLVDVTKAGMSKAMKEKSELEDDDATMTISGFRVSPEEDKDFRGIDYALTPKGAENVKEREWRPLPMQAMDQEWVRCGVNLVRWQYGKRLFGKDDWPPPPTTLMMKLGRKKA